MLAALKDAEKPNASLPGVFFGGYRMKKYVSAINSGKLSPISSAIVSTMLFNAWFFSAGVFSSRVPSSFQASRAWTSDAFTV